MRPASGYFFEDYAVGQRFDHAVPRTLTQGDVALYQALVGSRNPLHCSEPFAQSIGYPAMPVDDLLVFHIAFGKTVPDISYNAVANLGYAECRFVQPVYIGDTLHASTEIVGLKATSSGKTGVVYVRSSCFNQRDELVLTWVRWVMIHRRDTKATNIDLKPYGLVDFAAAVTPNAIAAPRGAWATPACAQATGSKKSWDDIEAPDADHSFANATVTTSAVSPILHAGGLTIDNTDHTLATKLYQNTARVHFDAHHMKDSRFAQRLVYGGHIISLCRALSFDGLENAFTIAAINSGSHLNPTFAGDTIYAMSVPLMKWAVSDSVGALRLQLHGYKNADPNSPTFVGTSPDQHVLSLDLTVLMPRRKP